MSVANGQTTNENTNGKAKSTPKSRALDALRKLRTQANRTREKVAGIGLGPLLTHIIGEIDQAGTWVANLPEDTKAKRLRVLEPHKTYALKSNVAAKYAAITNGTPAVVVVQDVDESMAIVRAVGGQVQIAIQKDHIGDLVQQGQGT